ncbi:MAG: hypothetical protein AAFQ14_17155 [Cyanobacteria bacterium J06621_12]
MMINLTYRGISYKSPLINQQLDLSEPVTPVDRCGSQKAQTGDRLISITPMNYYTYRGVSYSKNLVADLHQGILLDIARQ